jgi:nicotinate-nucleotide pyrophosphorylase (carboxylating)
MSIVPLDDILVRPIVDHALAEDLGRAGDITGQACIDPDARLSVVWASRQDGRVSGLSCARLSLAALDPTATFEVAAPDGSDVMPGAILARAEGNARAVLAAERTGLNLLGRLSGVATLTRAYVRLVEGTGATIVDTRKTTPGLRALENAILIKDNHVAACGGVGEAVRRARAHAGHLVKVEVEVDGLDQLDEALKHGPDVVMLDNFSLDDLKTAVRLAKGRAVLEASGGVNLTTVRAIAETGVDVISVGALTHSAPVLDIGLDAA